MSTIKIVWGFIFYCFYQFELKTSKIYVYFNPFYWLRKIRTLFSGNYKKNKDKDAFANVIFNRNNISMGWAEIYISGLSAIIVCIILNIFFGRSLFIIIQTKTIYYTGYIAIVILLSYFMNNKLLFAEKKYLLYFSKFETINSKRKILYGLISFLAIVLIIILLVFSLSIKGIFSFTK